MISYDGHVYERPEDIPDLGSLVCEKPQGKLRNYTGLLSDYNKLPKYDDLQSGSTASLVDERNPDDGIYAFMYESTTKSWYPV